MSRTAAGVQRDRELPVRFAPLCGERLNCDQRREIRRLAVVAGWNDVQPIEATLILTLAPALPAPAQAVARRQHALKYVI